MQAVRYILFFFVSFTSFFAQAQIQPDNWCGTTGMSPWLKWYHQHKHEIVSDRNSDTAWLYVPVTMHIVGNNSGSGYYPLEQAMRAVCEMNEQFEDARIRYYLAEGDGVRYHDNQSWYIHDWGGGSEMINSERIDGRLNVFVVQDPAGNCGYSWQDAIVIGKNCSAAGNSTWAHEAGHHFSLPHPFYGWEGTDWDYSQPAPEDIDGYPVEKTNGTNCYDSGDRFCDTRPDYLNYRWNCDDNAESTFFQKDPDGISFKSDASLIMGYSFDECASRFTPEQIEAMRTNLNTEHADYQVVFDEQPGIDDDLNVELVSPIDSQLTQYNNISLLWNAVPGATYYAMEISLNPNMQPRLYYNAVYNQTSVNVDKTMPNNRVLYWRVLAYSEWDICQPNDEAQIGIFKTKNFAATSELEQLLSTDLMPNPVAEGIPALLLISSDLNLDAVLDIHDAAGRLISQRNVRIYTGENPIEIPTDNFQSGVYILSLRTEKGTIMRRLVVGR